MLSPGYRIIKNKYMQKKEIHEGHLKRYEFAANFCEGQRVLDVACGFGTGSNLLAQKGLHVDGVDLDKEELAHARNFYKRDNLEFHEMDATSMSFPEDHFDLVVSFETLEHLSSEAQRKFLKEIKRVLRPSGKIILSTPDHYVWQRMALSWDQHIKELTKQELLDLMGEYFEVGDVYAQAILKTESFPRRLVRFILNTIKRIDYFGLRYKLMPVNFRKGLDNATTPVSGQDWDLHPASGSLTGAHIIVLAINKK